MLSCDQVQAALSARLDGEDPGVDDDVLDAHLASCDNCQAFYERAAQLNRRLSFGGGMDQAKENIPDLSDAILAGIEPQFRRQAASRALSASLSRVLLGVIGVFWIVGAVFSLGDVQALDNVDIDPMMQSLAFEVAATRGAFGFALFATAWLPNLSAGALPVFGATAMFSLGFRVRDLFMGNLTTGQIGELVLLAASVLALLWTWIASRGWIVLHNTWNALKAEPVTEH